VSARHRAGRLLLMAISAAAVALGLRYALSPSVMPYHEVALGASHAQLPPATAKLILALMKVFGYSQVALGIAMGGLVHFALRKGEAWAWWITLLGGAMAILPLPAVNLWVGRFSPWPLSSSVAVVFVVAIALCAPPRRR